MRIGLLGGTFNPVHNMHLAIASHALEVYHLERVELLPTYLPPHKSTQHLASAQDRLAMLRLAVATDPNLSINTYDLERKGKSYTYDTICYLQKVHPENEYFFIIGGDQVASLDTWYKSKELQKRLTFIGVSRDDVDVQQHPNVLPLSMPNFSLSSSYIRQRCAAHESIRYLVPEAVRQYIIEKGLYQDDNKNHL